MRKIIARSRVGVAVTATVVMVSTLIASTSYAEDQGAAADAIADLVQTAAAEATALKDPNPATLHADVMIDVPRDPDAGVIVGPPGDPVLEIPLPDAVHLD